MITVGTKLTNELHSAFKNRARFYGITHQELISILLENFVKGKYDEDLGIVSDERFEKGKL